MLHSHRTHNHSRRNAARGAAAAITASALAITAITSTLLTIQPEAHAQARLRAEVVADGLAQPLFMTHAPGDTERLFILEQNNARILILRDGVVEPTPFLDIGSLASSGGERGLLGLAFHPDYENNGWFFVNYTDINGNTVVARYTVSDTDPDVADPNSAETIITIDQPFSNHNGGMIQFSPVDGYLYIGMGDGGSAGDPRNLAQDPQELLGKMLRLDVDNGLPYTIPADNPFVNDPDTLDEIWAIGLRNPWRWAFDRETGDMWMGDVGQFLIEELNFQPFTSPGGENYGWRLKEGRECFNPSTNCDPGGLTDPILQYEHGGRPPRCSITGGFVYRGEQIPLLQGAYFFSDFCSSQIWTVRYNGSSVFDFVDRTDDIDENNQIFNVASFGQDAEGELYVLDLFDGEIFKIVTEMQVAADANTLIAGQQNTLNVSGATANADVYFVASLVGPGSTNVPPLGIRLGLANPQLVGTATADGSGNATFSSPLPASTQGLTVWLQAAEIGNSSNVQRYVIQ
ncbi:MAG: PQQ-dependent sugar dehydrogenase [Planctomycetota bacterium]